VAQQTRVWPGDVVVQALACNSRGCEFNSRLFCCQVTTLGKLFTHVPLSPSSIIWYQSQGSSVLRLVLMGWYSLPFTADWAVGHCVHVTRCSLIVRLSGQCLGYFAPPCSFVFFWSYVWIISGVSDGNDLVICLPVKRSSHLLNLIL